MFEDRREVINGRPVTTCQYDSLDEFADAARARKDRDSIWIEDLDEATSWSPGTWEGVQSYARNGWDEHLNETLDLAQEAVDTAEERHEIDTFHAVWDVTGCEVDVARYLAGEPENMIDYPMVKTPRQGRIVILCASIAYSAAIDADVIVRRGQVITAFALALSRMGIALELWTDWGCSADAAKQADFRIRTMVKGANDTLDPAKVLFAYSHPSNLRKLHFAVQNGFSDALQRKVGYGRGKPAKPITDMPEGTIYLPELRSGQNVPDAHEALRDLLKQAGFTE